MDNQTIIKRRERRKDRRKAYIGDKKRIEEEMEFLNGFFSRGFWP